MISILVITDASPTKCRGWKLPVTDQMPSDPARNYLTNVDYPLTVEHAVIAINNCILCNLIAEHVPNIASTCMISQTMTDGTVTRAGHARRSHDSETTFCRNHCRNQLIIARNADSRTCHRQSQQFAQFKPRQVAPTPTHHSNAR